MLPDTSSMHDEADGLGGVVEEGNRLRLPFVPHFEVALRQRRDELALAISHRDEHAQRVRGALEHGLLRAGPAHHAQDARHENSARDDSGLRKGSSIRRTGICAVIPRPGRDRRGRRCAVRDGAGSI